MTALGQMQTFSMVSLQVRFVPGTDFELLSDHVVIAPTIC